MKRHHRQDTFPNVLFIAYVFAYYVKHVFELQIELNENGQITNCNI